MGYQSEDVRSAAVEAYLSANRDIHRAQQRFSATYPLHGIVRLDKFMIHWVRVWDREHNVKSAPKPGRPHKMPASVALACSAAFKAGRILGGQRKHFSSLPRAIPHCPVIQRALATYPITQRFLLKRMRSLDERLVRRTESVKPALSPKLMEERRQVSGWLKRQPISYFQRIHWIDCKQMFICPRDRKVWTDAAWGAPTVHDGRAGMASNKLTKLKFYASVCWATGHSMLIFVTGTSPSAVKGLKAYQARSYPLAFVIHVARFIHGQLPQRPCSILLLAVGAGVHAEPVERPVLAALYSCADQCNVLLCVVPVQSEQSLVQSPASPVEVCINLLLLLHRDIANCMVVFKMTLAINLNHQVQGVLAVLGECQVHVSWTIQALEDLDLKAGHYVISPFHILPGIHLVCRGPFVDLAHVQGVATNALQAWPLFAVHCLAGLECHMLPALKPEPLLCLSGNAQVLLAEPPVPIRDPMLIGFFAHFCPALCRLSGGGLQWVPPQRSSET